MTPHNVERNFRSTTIAGLLSILSAYSGCSSGDGPLFGAGALGDSAATGGATSTKDKVGYCADTCTASCATDDDCDPSRGELCCTLSATEKYCLEASQCPIACDDDSKCDTKSGKVCARTNIATEQKYCIDPVNAINTCQFDSDCSGSDVCCMNYKQPFCLPPGQCPKSCTESSACQTASGEVCCKSVTQIEPMLNVTGLCANPDSTAVAGYSACPKTCSVQLDCGIGENCCNGLCSSDKIACPDRCKDITDCNGQLCCKTPPVRVPKSITYVFNSAPTCSGKPSGTCETGACSALGCDIATTCTDRGRPCSDYQAGESYCKSVTGCTYEQQVGSCKSLGLYTGCSSYWSKQDCITSGCNYDASTSACSGTPIPCSSFTSQATCDSGVVGCGWSNLVVGTCSGTPVPCSDIAGFNACSDNMNCDATPYSSNTCVGTPTPCHDLSTAECSTQSGCKVTTSPTSI